MRELTSLYSSRYARQKLSFLDKVQKVLNWRPVEILLNKVLGNRSDATGVLGYPALMMFKILLLQLWYNLSDREIDRFLLDGIGSFRKFLGFSPNANTPSYSTICRFRNRLIKLGLDKELFTLVSKSIKSNWFIGNKGAIIDSTIVLSSRRPLKVINMNNNLPSISYSGDEDAKWTVKSGRAYYGYKIHMITDLKHGFIAGGLVTGANCSDTKELPRMISGTSLKQGAIVLADKGYASQSNRDYLNKCGFRDGIMHKALRGLNLSKEQKLKNATISSVRGAVERVFGTLKQKYNLHRTKYIGLIKTKAQFLLSAIAFNIKKALSFVN